MALLETIRKRYSCRAYQEKAIEADKLAQVFEAARLAPSAKNLQDWRFVVVTDSKTKLQLAKAANNQMFLAKASAIIVACSNSEMVMTCGQPIAQIDVSIALEHICLQATELGLATCWIGSFFSDKVRAILGIPKNIEIIELMSLGYPADEPNYLKRKPIENILCYEKWQF
ncbi:nitroreductase family protein [Planctomycetota bacterium]